MEENWIKVLMQLEAIEEKLEWEQNQNKQFTYVVNLMYNKLYKNS